MNKDIYESLNQITELIQNIKDNKTSGMEDIPIDQIWQRGCNDRDHNPPSQICIPHGKQYRHICPSCQLETILRPPQITY